MRRTESSAGGGRHRSRMARAAIIALLAMSGAAAGSSIQPAFEAESGRSLEKHPPDRVVDHLHMRLEITIADMDRPRLQARQTLSVSPIAYAARELTLDAKLLEIEQVASPGRQVDFEHDGMVLTVRLDPPLGVGEQADLVMDYSAVDPPDGLFWTPQSEAWPDRPAQIHTQGQPETNSYWFPCHDFPDERLTTELIVAAPESFVVSANGALLDRRGGRHSETGQRVEIWHFSQDQPHPAYLVSLIVGKFDVVDIGEGDLPMPVYVPPGRAGDVEGTFGMTAEMVRFYEEILDEPYPWSKYAQLVVHNFGAGGMENTSATTLFDTAIIAEDELDDHDLIGLISHELVHQWFGDLVTCESWEHIWLNEGFATYGESLWWEHEGGEDGYNADVLSNFESVIAEDSGRAPEQPPMVSRRYEHPDDVFSRASNPYPKGASILHMLRRRVGDEAFFAILREHVDRHRLQSIETVSLRQLAEEISGESLQQFFDQWAYRPGIPRLAADVAWDDAAGALTIAINQTQHINSDNPAFIFDLPIYVELPPRRGQRDPVSKLGVVEVRGRSASASFPLPDRPEMVAINPHLDVLAEIRVNQPPRGWLNQLHHGPSLPARVQAARHLAAAGGLDVGDALLDVALDGSSHAKLRTATTESLAERGDDERLLRLASRGIDEPRVRVAVAEGLATVAAEADRIDRRMIDTLEHIAREDTSTRARAAAIRALGQLGSREHLRLIVRASELESQHDGLRRASLDALEAADAPEGVPVALRLSEAGHNQRTRAAALETLAALAHHAPDEALERLAAMLGDRVAGVREAAREGLVSLGDERGLTHLEHAASRTRDPVQRRRLNDAQERLRERGAG